MSTTWTTADLAALYRDTRERVVGLLGDLGRDELDAPVPACPGWSVSDVVAHLTAVAEDVLAGRLTGPPSDEETAEQVARFRGWDLHAVVDHWTGLAPRFEEMVGTFTVWPAVLDVVSHEQDIRGALGRPGGRDTEAVRVGAESLLARMSAPVTLVVRFEDGEVPVGGDDGGAAPLVLDTTRFETVRWRLGRRSRAQLARMAWSGDPAPVLDHLVIFGPSPEDIHE